MSILGPQPSPQVRFMFGSTKGSFRFRRNENSEDPQCQNLQLMKYNPTQMAKMKNSRLSLCKIRLRFSNEKLHYFLVFTTF